MSRSIENCVFCKIVAGDAPATIVRAWSHAIAIKPLNPVTDGHTLVLPRQHVVSAAEAPIVAGEVALYAANLAAETCDDFNLILNTGSAASQTVWHLHWHIVPRRAGDGLQLPWTEQMTSRVRKNV